LPRRSIPDRGIFRWALEWKPQAAAVDIGLPHLDGYEVAHADDARKAREAGFDLCFAKRAEIEQRRSLTGPRHARWAHAR
jgi:hypothetical protein